jgi:hypothetical protein
VADVCPPLLSSDLTMPLSFLDAITTVVDPLSNYVPGQIVAVIILIPAMVISLVLMRWNQQLASPVVAIVNRWLRWGILAGGGAQLCLRFGWTERPFSTLFVVFFIGWFLLESIYHWLAIHAMSVSPLPLFPRFTLNRAGDEWPVQSRFLVLREQIRSAGFKQMQSLRSEIMTGIYLRVSLFQNADNTTRLQVTFVPQPMGTVTVCLHLATSTAAGDRIVTDNHYIPFGGFYPENWRLERRPCTRRFLALLKRHRNRVTAAAAVPVPWVNEPLNDLNIQQGELERINTELGFLLPSTDHEEHGRISHEGRYRVWKEMFTLNYFGRASRYE